MPWDDLSAVFAEVAKTEVYDRVRAIVLESGHSEREHDMVLCNLLEQNARPSLISIFRSLSGADQRVGIFTSDEHYGPTFSTRRSLGSSFPSN
jgi:hypothetical protein